MTILFCGDPHGCFDHIVSAASQRQASAVVLLGDMEPDQPLQLELQALRSQQIPVWWIPGNHDADSDALWQRVWGSELLEANVHGRVVTLPNGLRLAGLGGVFRESVWYPASRTREEQRHFESREQHARHTPRQDRWQGGPHRRHWGSIYPKEFESLARHRADILITHEAPGYHPLGFPVLDELARSLGVRFTVHGHHHDRRDSSADWEGQGFRSYGVGLRGITAIDADGVAEVVVPGECDGHHR